MSNKIRFEILLDKFPNIDSFEYDEMKDLIRSNLFKYIEGRGYVPKENKYNLKDIVVVSLDLDGKYVREVFYVSLATSPLDSSVVRDIFEKIESDYRQGNSGINYRIIALNGYLSNNKADFETSANVFNYQQFGVKLEEKSFLLNLDGKYVDLMGHNQYTFDKAMHYINNGCKEVCAIQPTGSGKSFLLGKFISIYESTRVLLLAPSRYILEQFLETFEWMNNNPNIKLMTYSKLAMLSEDELQEIVEFEPSLIAFDEYHRLGARSWGAAKDRLYQALHNDFKSFAVTATPIRYLDSSRDMSYELFNGNIANSISLNDAIVKNILPMPKYITAFHDIKIDTDKISKKISKSKTDDVQKAQLRSLLKAAIYKWTTTSNISHIIKKHITSERKFIVFCENTEHLDELMIKCKEWFSEAFDFKIPVNTYKVLSSYNDSKKDFESFTSASNDSFSLLFSVNALNEGVHPEVDGVIFCRATSSGIIYYQQQGRCFKVSSGKTPLIFDLVNNAQCINRVPFREQLEEAFNTENALRASYGLDAINASEGFEHSVVDETQDILNLLKTLESRLSVPWEEYYERLKAFYEAKGHVSVPKEYDPNLYVWLSKERASYNKGTLTAKKIELLEKLGIIWDPNENLFNIKYIKLSKFYRKFKHSRVPHDYEDQTLYNWVTSLRAKYASGELSDEHIAKLNKLDFVWNVNEDEWMNGFKDMKVFYNTYGHSNVTLSNGNSSLYYWRNRAKKMYKEGKLSPERITLLREIKFDFSTQEDIFEGNFKELEAFFKKNKHTLVTKSNSSVYLTNWVIELRKKYSKGLLSEDIIKRLEALGFVWKVYDAKWFEKLNEMKQYYNKNGHLTMKSRGEYSALYKWIRSQHREYLAGTMPLDRVKILDDFDFINKLELGKELEKSA